MFACKADDDSDTSSELNIVPNTYLIPNQSNQQWQDSNLETEEYDLGFRGILGIGQQQQQPNYQQQVAYYDNLQPPPLQNPTRASLPVLQPQQLNNNQQLQRSHSNRPSTSSSNSNKKRKKRKKKVQEQDENIAPRPDSDKNLFVKRQENRLNQHAMAPVTRRFDHNSGKGMDDEWSDDNTAHNVPGDLEFEGRKFVPPNNLKSCKSMLKRAVIAVASLTMDKKRLQYEARELKKRGTSPGVHVRQNKEVIKQVQTNFGNWQFRTVKFIEDDEECKEVTGQLYDMMYEEDERDKLGEDYKDSWVDAYFNHVRGACNDKRNYTQGRFKDSMVNFYRQHKKLPELELLKKCALRTVDLEDPDEYLVFKFYWSDLASKFLCIWPLFVVHEAGHANQLPILCLCLAPMPGRQGRW